MNPSAAALCRSYDPLYPRLKEFLIASPGLAYYAERDQDLVAIIGHRLSELGREGCGSYLELLSDASDIQRTSAGGRREVVQVKGH
jgi:hypothetical protein